MPADRSSYNQHNFHTARGSLLVPYPSAEEVSQIRILTSKITQVCQDICDIKLRRLLITQLNKELDVITNGILIIKVIVRILGVQAEADLTLRTLMKIVLRVIMTTFTKFPIPSNTTLRTTKRIMEDVLLNRGQNLPERLQSHFQAQILLKLLKHLHCF